MLRCSGRPLRGVALLALTAVLMAGCDSQAAIAKDKLSALVLSQKEMPSGFSEFYNGPQVRLDNQGTVRSDASRDGREGGWITRLRRADPGQTQGPLVIESRADLFKDSSGAKADLAAYRVVFSRASGTDLKNVAVSGLGEEAVGITFTQPGGRTLRYYRIAWRYRNATASVLIEGFDGELSLNDAESLARKQETLMERAG
jgi:hypothetical protein